MNAIRALIAAYRTPSVGRHTSKAIANARKEQQK